MDDGRIDWDGLISAKNFNGRKINWYPSDFNGLSEAFGGSIARGFEWNTMAFDCKNSKWSFDISNVQRAAPSANLFKIRHFREPLTPSDAPYHGCPRLGCAFVYVLSREAWEKVSIPGLDRTKGLHGTQCWTRDLYDNQLTDDPGPEVPYFHSVNDRMGRLPEIVTDEMRNSAPDFHSGPPSSSQDKTPVETLTPKTDVPVRVPDRGPSRPGFNNSTNLTTEEEFTIEQEFPARHSWVPRREDSLVIEHGASQEATATQYVLHSPVSTSPAQSFPDYFLKEVDMCFQVHFLETVFEEDEDSDVESPDLPTTAKDERMVSLTEPGDEQPSSLETSLSGFLINRLYGPPESKEASSLSIKCRALVNVAVIISVNHILRMAIQAHLGLYQQMFGRQEGRVVEGIVLACASLIGRILLYLVVIKCGFWMIVFFDVLRDPAFWPPYEWLDNLAARLR